MNGTNSDDELFKSATSLLKKKYTKMKNGLKLFLAIVFVLSFSSCEYTDIILSDGSDIVVKNDLSFSEDIEPIFKAKNCTSCHPGLKQPDLTEGKAYQSLLDRGLFDTENASESKIYTVPLPDGSHTVRYSAEQAAMVLAWIKQGALNN